MLTDTKIAAIKPPESGQDEHKDSGPGYVQGLRLRIGTSGKKTWTLRARAGQKLVNKKLGTYPTMRIAAARKAAQALLDAIAKEGSTTSADRTFEDVSDAWLKKKRADRKHNRSVGQQQRQLELHVLPKWRERKIVEIKRADVRELVEGIEGDILPNRVLALVRTIFRYALSQDWIEASRPKQSQSRKTKRNAIASSTWVRRSAFGMLRRCLAIPLDNLSERFC